MLATAHTPRRIATAAAALVTAMALAATTVPATATVRGALRGKRTLKPAEPEITPLVMLADLLSRLQLTDDQKQQIKGIFSEHKEELLAIAAAEHTTRTVLRATIHQADVNSVAVTRASAAVAAADVQLSLERARIFSEIYAVLTEEQRATLAAFIEEVKGRILGRLADLSGREVDLDRLLARAGGRLELTPEQKEEIKAILAAHKDELSAIVAAEVAARTTLNAAIHQPELNENAVRRACTAVAAADLELNLERAELYSELWGVLTPEQQQELTELIAAIEARIAERLRALLTILHELF